ncbi:hypothetical protein CB1_000698009 [Camelus ferus]|nr:hypothetical protein CB1_000698009 [Camelus ferus]
MGEEGHRSAPSSQFLSQLEASNAIRKFQHTVVTDGHSGRGSSHLEADGKLQITHLVTVVEIDVDKFANFQQSPTFPIRGKEKIGRVTRSRPSAPPWAAEDRDWGTQKDFNSVSTRVLVDQSIVHLKQVISRKQAMQRLFGPVKVLIDTGASSSKDQLDSNVCGNNSGMGTAVVCSVSIPFEDVDYTPVSP